MASATIIATPTDSEATVSFSVPDAVVDADGHQVNLDSGLNTVNITVTAANGVAIMEYVLDLGRGSTDPLGWKAQDDLDGLIATGNERPHGIWGDTTTIWVVDYVTDKVYAYNRDGTAGTSKEFQLDSSNMSPRGIWSNGEIMWVADSIEKNLFAYVLSDGTHVLSRDILDESVSPRGIWSDGTTMWVFDANDRYIYAYMLSDGTRDSSKDLDVSDGVAGASDIWSDGTRCGFSSAFRSAYLPGT